MPCVATIGFFDGVHRGHQFLIGCVKQIARERDLSAVIITFPVHPRMVMQPGFQMPLLSTPAEKRQMLEAQGGPYRGVAFHDGAFAIYGT